MSYYFCFYFNKNFIYYFNFNLLNLLKNLTINFIINIYKIKNIKIKKTNYIFFSNNLKWE